MGVMIASLSGWGFDPLQVMITSLSGWGSDSHNRKEVVVMKHGEEANLDLGEMKVRHGDVKHAEVDRHGEQRVKHAELNELRDPHHPDQPDQKFDSDHNFLLQIHRIYTHQFLNVDKRDGKRVSECGLEYEHVHAHTEN